MVEVDIVLLILRLWLGVVIAFHGINHWRSLEGTASWFESKGFKSAKLNARISAYAEVLIGVGLAVGLLTVLAVVGLVAIMFVAFWSIHRFAGFFNFHRPDEGYEYVATLVVAGLTLAVIGPGQYSIDQAIGIASDFDGWVGFAAIGLGLLFGYGQTIVFWKRPEKETSND